MCNKDWPGYIRHTCVTQGKVNAALLWAKLNTELKSLYTFEQLGHRILPEEFPQLHDINSLLPSSMYVNDLRKTSWVRPEGRSVMEAKAIN